MRDKRESKRGDKEMEIKGDVTSSGTKEEIIKKAEPEATIEKIIALTKKAYERKTADEIVPFVMNLDDYDEADIFTMLYVKAVNSILEADKENFKIDENEVRKIISETDQRFVYVEGVCEECEDE
jgi:Asp-tRNA(Asn)/Glu-tRNA(Gln) amidotransferase C subunit